MRLLFAILLVSSLVVSMQNPKNMSREQLEQAYRNAQQTIAHQTETIAMQRQALDMLVKLHYGSSFERACAHADLQKIRMAQYLNNYSNGSPDILLDKR